MKSDGLGRIYYLTGLVNPSGYASNARKSTGSRYVRYAFERKNFKNSPNKHDWTMKELMAHYKMGRDAVVNELFPLIGRKTAQQEREEQRLAITNHPKFGNPGERAPCPAKQLANEVNISVEWASKLRKKMGVRPFSAAYDFTGRRKTPGLHRGRNGLLSGPYIPTKTELAVYSFVGICNNWKRPEGIDAHLESRNG